MTRTQKRSLIIVVFALAAIFIPISQYRLIDGDEGFYLLAAKLVYEGKVLYRDFLYTQMPLLPYVYGAWLKIGGDPWVFGRFLSALLASVLGCLVYWNVTRITGRRLAGLLSLLLFVGSTGILVWMPIIKTYALSGVFLFGVYMLLCEASNVRILALAGILFGFSVDTRLFVAGVLPVFLSWIYSRRKLLPGLIPAYGSFVAGLVAGLVFNLPFFLASPRNYFFNNLGYHSIRGDSNRLIGAFHQKASLLLQVIGLHRSREAQGWPLGLLLMVNVLPILFFRKRTDERVRLAAYVGLTLVFLSMLPTPTYTQYYCLAIPFLIVGAAAFAIAGSLSTLRVALIAALLLIYIAPMPMELQRYTQSGVDVIGIIVPERAIDFRLHTMRQIEREIDSRTTPGEPVLSLWSGYLPGTHASSLPGVETDVGLYIAPKLSRDQLQRYHVLSQADLEAGLKLHSPCLVVLGNEDSMHNFGANFPPMLERDGYRVAYNVGHTTIYTCRP